MFWRQRRRQCGATHTAVMPSDANVSVSKPVSMVVRCYCGAVEAILTLTLDALESAATATPEGGRG